MRFRWRNLELPSRVVVDRDTLTSTFGRFSVEPYERGFGHTIGNGLRRILLSSIEGAAVRWFRMTGATHEFQCVDGVVEDMTDIVLQIKQLLVRCPSEGPITLRIETKEKGAITAGDIDCEGDAEILNPDLHICTLSKSMNFEMEMEVVRGRGYTTAEENENGGGRHSDAGARRGKKEVEQEIGKIWVDSIFSPVLRVRYGTEDCRVGRLTDYDRMVIEVWTDGTIGPEDALMESAKIYRKCLNPLVAYGSPGAEVQALGQEAITEEVNEDSGNDLLNQSVASLELSVRARNCLEAERINTIGDLVRHSENELLEVRNLGKTSLLEIQAKLVELGLALQGSSQGDV